MPYKSLFLFQIYTRQNYEFPRFASLLIIVGEHEQTPESLPAAVTQAHGRWMQSEHAPALVHAEDATGGTDEKDSRCRYVSLSLASLLIDHESGWPLASSPRTAVNDVDDESPVREGNVTGSCEMRINRG